MLDIKTVDGKKIDYPKQAQGFHGYYTVDATKWSVDSEGDIRDGEMLIAEPSYLSKYGRKNAALIAAAPELLSSLESILSYFTPSGEFEMHECFEKEFKDDFFEAVNAVNKAKGV